jgi:hypothetical protein
MTENLYEKKKAKRYVIISTIIYIFLIPILFLWAAIMLAVGTDSTLEVIIRILRFLIPVTMAVCTCTMWSRYYVYEQYKKVSFFALLPLLPIGVFILAETISDFLR